MEKKRKLKRIGEMPLKISSKVEKEFVKKVDSFHEEAMKLIDEVNFFILNLKKDQKEILDVLNSVKKTNENVDATLCKVLLAIRQNEYLQAWYPNDVKCDKR